MHRSEIAVDPDPHRHCRIPNMGSMGTHTRTRKSSLDHYSNTLLLDRNGNSSILRRLASLSEDDNEPGVNGDDPDVTSEHTWKKTFLNQIQNLLKDVNMSQTLSEKVYDEIMDKTINNNTSVRNRRSSCFTLTGTENPKRRSSIIPQNVSTSVENRGRRMSHAGMASSLQPTSGRRCSVAHLPSYGRRLSCTNNNFLPNQEHFLRQRRKSSAKPIALNVVKVSSVQKQLHKIYKKRRRRNRGSVNIEDVKDALRSPDEKTNSDSEPEVDTSDKENSNEDKDTNSPEVWEDIPDGSGSPNVDSEEINSSDRTDECPDGQTNPVTRRRDSTQMRAFELSRKLRQRRRGRRQVSADF